jgi:hypothetical protein
MLVFLGIFFALSRQKIFQEKPALDGYSLSIIGRTIDTEH